MAVRGGHRFERQRRGVRRKRREDPAAVEPSCAALAEDRIPVDVAGLHRRRGGVRAVGGPESRPDAEAALDEVQAVADASPDAVVGEPRDVGGVDASLEDQVLQQAAERVVGERRDDRSAEPEAPPKPARDVVLAASLRDRKRARGRDAAVARVEAEHDLAERHEVVAAVLGRSDRDDAHAATATAASSTASRARRSISSNRCSARSFRSQIHVPPQASTDGSSR